MSEISPPQLNAEPLDLRGRLTVALTLTATILTKNVYISSGAALDETETAIETVNTRSTFLDGAPITFEHRQNTAAMQTMQSLIPLFKPNAEISIPRRVNGAEMVYAATERTLRAIGLPATERGLDMKVFKVAKAAIPALEPPTSGFARTLREVWDERGTVTERVFRTDDIRRALARKPDEIPTDVGISPDSILYAGYELPQSPEFDITIPYYFRHVDELHGGALEMLDAYLEDIQTLDQRLRQNA